MPPALLTADGARSHGACTSASQDCGANEPWLQQDLTRSGCPIIAGKPGAETSCAVLRLEVQSFMQKLWGFGWKWDTDLPNISKHPSSVLLCHIICFLKFSPRFQDSSGRFQARFGFSSPPRTPSGAACKGAVYQATVPWVVWHLRNQVQRCAKPCIVRFRKRASYSAANAEISCDVWSTSCSYQGVCQQASTFIPWETQKESSRSAWEKPLKFGGDVAFDSGWHGPGMLSIS